MSVCAYVCVWGGGRLKLLTHTRGLHTGNLHVRLVMVVEMHRPVNGSGARGCLRILR